MHRDSNRGARIAPAAGAPPGAPAADAAGADDSTSPRASTASSGDEARLLNVEPPRLTCWGTFEDAREERAFREDALRERYIRVFWRFATILLPINLFVITMDQLSTGGVVTILTRTSLSIFSCTCAALLVFGAAKHGGPRWRPPLWALEAFGTSWIAALAVLSTLQYPARLVYFADERDAQFLLARSDECSWSLGSVLLRSLTVLVLAGLFTPTQTPHFAFVAVFTAAVNISFEVLTPIASTPGDAVREAVYYFVNLGLVLGAHVHRVRIERAGFHFRRSVLAGSRAWRELKAQENEQRVRASAAEAAKGARSRLVRVVMHDLRSPLLAVYQLAFSLREQPPATTLADDGVTRSLEAMAKCANLMQSIVSDMLDFERIDSGRLQLVTTNFNLRTLLGDARDAFAPLATSSSVRLEFEPLPPGLEHACFEGDDRRLLQCLGNLLSNATKFTPSGGTISVRAWGGEALRGAGGTDGAGGAGGADGATATATADGSADDSVATACTSAAPPQPQPQPQPHSRAPPTHLLRSSTASSAAGPTPGLLRRRMFGDGSATELVPPGGPPDDEPPRPLHELCIAVRDSGAGLEPSELAVLRRGDIFSQVGKGQLQGNGGTGLGLSIVRHLLWMHSHSELDIASEGHARGSEFTLRLRLPRTADMPAAKPADDDDDAPPPPRRRMPTQFGGALGAAVLAAAAGAAAPAKPEPPGRPPAITARKARYPSDASTVHALPVPSASALPSPHRAPAMLLEPISASGDLADMSASLGGGSRLASPALGSRLGPAAAAAEPAAARAPLRCLYVEDDEVLRLITGARLFGKLGLGFDEAADGVAGLEAMRACPAAHTYAAVLIDNQMPRMSGSEAVKQMRADGYPGLIIGMTGDPTGSADRSAFEESGLTLCCDKTPEGLDLIEMELQKLIDEDRAAHA